MPITDKSLTNNADDGEPKFEKPEIQPPEVKIVSPEASDAPVTVSSVDQISVSAVDLDISKAVEKGISDAKKEDKSVSQDTTEPSKDELIKEENKCSECENEKVSKKDAVQDVGETKVQEAKKGLLLYSFQVFTIVHKYYRDTISLRRLPTVLVYIRDVNCREPP